MTQVIGLLSLLVELQAGKITTPEKDVPATTSGSSSSHVVDEVLALVNGVSSIAGAIFDVRSTIDPTIVRAQPLSLPPLPTT